MAYKYIKPIIHTSSTLEFLSEAIILFKLGLKNG